jgi:periplasmic protein TonB
MKLSYKTFLFLLVFFSVKSRAQSWGDSSVLKEDLFVVAEQAPLFPGGMEGFYSFIAKNLKNPANKVIKVSRKVVEIRFVIGKDGSVLYGDITRGLNEDFNKEALELIKKMPKWEPAKQNGRNVFFMQSIPLLFVDD